jgi:Zn-dependent protease with chaperone function
LIAATYFNGSTAQRHAVTLTLSSGILSIRGEDVERDERLDDINIPGRLGNTPRMIYLSDGARCEVGDHAGFEALMAEAGIARSCVERLDAHWGHVFASLVVVVAFAVAGYLWGLPFLAEKAAFKVPDSVLVMLDDQFFKTFDGPVLHPSQLGKERREVLTSRIAHLNIPNGMEKPRRIEFRSAPMIGPNAFALPGGSVVVLDEIVALTHDDEEILAVLSHEMGHVAERHALRQMLQASVVGVAMAWYVGDISSLLAIAPTALLQTRYSRDFEWRADAFGARVLKQNNIAPTKLADILEKLQAAYLKKGTETPDQECTADPGKAESADRSSAKKTPLDSDLKILDYFSTHPDTQARINAIRGQP